MDNIYFNNEEEFNSMTQYYSGGFESQLYRYRKGDSELLIKKYYTHDQIKIDKIKRISMLKTEELKLVSEWDKTFPQSEKVEHKKVTFVNRYGITLVSLIMSNKVFH